MNERLIGVKVYHLSGAGLTIQFSMEDPKKPELVYTDQQGERRFTGEEICREKTQLGLMATVVLEEMPDLHRKTCSVAIPDGNRPKNMKSFSMKSFAVRTTARTSIAGPGAVSGQIQTHEACVLEGNAW